MDEIRLNIGCGQTPTAGWKNIDNSPSIILSRLPIVSALMGAAGMLSKASRDFIQFARRNEIAYANVTKRIPEAAGTVGVIYSSHMFEHLDPVEARRFLAEAMRVLKPGGIIRLSVPDIRLMIEDYVANGDADRFVGATGMAQPRARSLSSRVMMGVYGNRRHNWMYDGRSLCRIMAECGFEGADVMPAGQTKITDPGPLDLHERADASVYVEARKPLR